MVLGFVAQIDCGRNPPYRRRSYAMVTVVGVPSRVKRLRMAARTCSSATWRSKSRAITRSPSSLKQRILVTTRLRRWYDNAPMESFWGSLKNEMIHHQRYATRANAEASIKEYIEIFYNRQRRHSRLGYVSPASFAKNFRKQALAA